MLLDEQFGTTITCRGQHDDYAEKLLMDQFDKLEADAPIILESCYTGQEMAEGQENMAQFISRAANRRTVYAPSREALPIDKTVTFSQEHGFNVGIKGIKASTKFAKGSFLRRMHAVWLGFRGIQEDITRKFVAGNPVNP